MSEDIHMKYDELLTDVFTYLEKYQQTIKKFEDHQYEGFDALNEAERQGGLFGPQINSSSYYGSNLRSSLRVIPPPCLIQSNPSSDNSLDNPEETPTLPHIVDVYNDKQLFCRLVRQHLEKKKEYLKSQEDGERKEQILQTPPTFGFDDAGDDDDDEYHFDIAEYNKLLLENEPSGGGDDDDGESSDDTSETTDGEELTELTKRKLHITRAKEEQASLHGEPSTTLSNNPSKQGLTTSQAQTSKSSDKTLTTHTLSSYIALSQPDILRLFSINPSIPLTQAQSIWRSLTFDQLPILISSYYDLLHAIEKAEKFKEANLVVLQSK